LLGVRRGLRKQPLQQERTIGLSNPRIGPRSGSEKIETGAESYRSNLFSGKVEAEKLAPSNQPIASPDSTAEF